MVSSNKLKLFQPLLYPTLFWTFKTCNFGIPHVKTLRTKFIRSHSKISLWNSHMGLWWVLLLRPAIDGGRGSGLVWIASGRIVTPTTLMAAKDVKVGSLTQSPPVKLISIDIMIESKMSSIRQKGLIDSFSKQKNGAWPWKSRQTLICVSGHTC